MQFIAKFYSRTKHLILSDSITTLVQNYFSHELLLSSDFLLYPLW